MAQGGTVLVPFFFPIWMRPVELRSRQTRRSGGDRSQLFGDCRSDFFWGGGCPDS